jgi:hypothetical protein
MISFTTIFSAPLHRWLIARGLAYPSWRECSLALAWAREQLSSTIETELVLPPNLAMLSRNNVIQAIQTSDCRTCTLLKKTIGWKGNFTGTLCCDKPIEQGEIVRGKPPFSDYISINGSVYFNELYVTKPLSEFWFHVNFNLH